MQQQSRVAGVQPAGGRVDGVQYAVRQATRPLQRSKLCAVQRRQQQLLRDALAQDGIHGLAHRRGKFAGAFLGGAPQHQFQHRLQGAVIKADVNVRAQLFGQQCSLQRRVVGAQQHIQKDFHPKLAFPVGKVAGVPCQCALYLVRLRLFGVVRQFHTGTVLRLLRGQMRAAAALRHLREIVLVQLRQLFGHVHFAVQGDAAVFGAVVAAVHPLILLIGQRRDALRVAAGHEAVCRIREHGPLQRIFQLGIRRSQRALHLIVHHAADGAVRVPMPAFLLEHSFVHHGQRAEHCIQVDVHQVLEVGLVGGREWIHRLVREGHGIQERRHTALEQLQERRRDRVFFAARQHRVLQNMEHAGVVGREGAEPDAERLVVVLIFHQKNRCSADVVGQHGQHTVLLRAILSAQNGITGILLHCSFSFSVLKSLTLLYHSLLQNTIAGL